MTKLIVHTKEELSPKCTVQMDNEIASFKEFVVIGFDSSDASTHMYQFADPLTVGFAHKLITKAFIESYNKLSAEDKELVDKEIDKI